MEIWKPVKNWESLYEISNLGRVKSIGNKRMPEKILRQFKRKGYLNVNLCYQYNRLCANVHRLVCESFIPNPCNYPIINHKDGNPLNNNVSNLEWCTISHNTKHAWNIGAFVNSKLFKRNRQ